MRAKKEIMGVSYAYATAAINNQLFNPQQQRTTLAAAFLFFPISLLLTHSTARLWGYV